MRTALSIVALILASAFTAAPAGAADACSLRGLYVGSLAVADAAGPGQVAFRLTFDPPPDCTSELGSVTLAFKARALGGDEIEDSLELIYRVTNNTVEIGSLDVGGVLVGEMGPVAENGIAQTVALVGHPTIAGSLVMSGTALWLFVPAVP